MEWDDELLRLELTELYISSRHHFQLYLAWYTFFLTVNFAAIGWFSSVLLTGGLKASLPIFLVAIFFITQVVLSYLASKDVRNYYRSVDARCNELLAELVSPEAKLQPRSVIPLAVYVKVIDLMCYTLISFGLFWVGFTSVAVYIVPL